MKMFIAIIILIFVAMVCVIAQVVIERNKVESSCDKILQHKTTIEVHRRYKETMVLNGDTNVTYVDSITFSTR